MKTFSTIFAVGENTNSGDPPIFAVGETLPAGQAANIGDPPLPVFSLATFRTT